jgi:23S rRNA pseudouridine2605 synthase
MTNDGDLAYRLTHPRFKIEKTYRVTVDGTVDENMISRIAGGVRLDGSMTMPCAIRVLERRPGGTVLEVKLREGRKRQIRRMFSLCGRRVVALVRTALGPLEFADCDPGTMRPLTRRERRQLMDCAGLIDSAGEESV